MPKPVVSEKNRRELWKVWSSNQSGHQTTPFRRTSWLRSNGLSFLEILPWFALFPVVGTGRIDVPRGLVSASVVSRVMAVNSSHIKGMGSGQTASVHSVHSIAAERSAKPRTVGTARLDGIQLTTVHKYEPRATKPHAVGTRL
ncbi:hypothetical protein AVEN_232205-1 [Araneus ventricosus]|uniref:Uncharacterized protein n=1 Tax=Araneus ventricosus TaxID=182803 RepID=A0A4Y2S2E6_ARAVE|nr:hypothetical protein AVEN_232205-1 [Araneus ventricosus]